MSITITDPELIAQLSQAGDLVELKDPNGRLLGTFLVEKQEIDQSKIQSPFSREEMEERIRTNRTGRTLRDILRDLESRSGK